MKGLKFLYLYIFVAFLLCSSVALAGPVKISGQITDENNEPLEFVNIRIAGTAIGATSDIEGK